jgi:hypothetical protein
VPSTTAVAPDRRTANRSPARPAANSAPHTHPRDTRDKTLAGNWKQENTPKKLVKKTLDLEIMERILH